MASISISLNFQNNSQISLLRNRNRNFCSVFKATKLVRRDLLIGTLGLYGGSKMSGIITTGEDAGESAANAAAEETTSNPNNRVVELSQFPIVLDSVVTVTVPRPKKSRTKAQKAEKEEALAIVGIEFVADKTTKFDVHVNDDVDSLSRPDKSEFAGSFCYLPHKRKVVTTSLRLGLTDLLEDVGADDDDSIKVTLVPKYVKRPVTIRQIRIEYLD